MRVIFVLLLTLFIAFTTFAENTHNPQMQAPSIISERRVIVSKSLGEERPYFVYLPKTYNEKTIAPKYYPVLYLVDGEIFFHLSSVVHLMGASSIGIMNTPEMIFVAIPNVSDRTRDLTPTQSLTDWQYKETDEFLAGGGAGAFLDFITTELMPEIETSYRTKPFRIIVGHSLGGLFALNAFLTNSETFQCYIAMDSSLWWDNNMPNRALSQFFSNDSPVKAKIYLSLSEHGTVGDRWQDNSSTIIENMRFAEQLRKKGGPGVDVELQNFPGEDLPSVGLISFYYGLKHCFGGYKPRFDTVMSGAGAIAAHFESFSKVAGVEFLPPEDFINLMARSANMNYERPDIALELLALNAKDYPASSYAQSRLADFYKKSGKPKLALLHYKKALALNPENQEAKIGLGVLD